MEKSSNQPKPPVAEDLKESIQEIRESYEKGLVGCGIEHENVDYDKLAQVREIFDEGLERFIRTLIEQERKAVVEEAIECMELINEKNNLAFEKVKNFKIKYGT